MSRGRLCGNNPVNSRRWGDRPVHVRPENDAPSTSVSYLSACLSGAISCTSGAYICSKDTADSFRRDGEPRHVQSADEVLCGYHVCLMSIHFCTCSLQLCIAKLWGTALDGRFACLPIFLFLVCLGARCASGVYALSYAFMKAEWLSVWSVKCLHPSLQDCLSNCAKTFGIAISCGSAGNWPLVTACCAYGNSLTLHLTALTLPNSLLDFDNLFQTNIQLSVFWCRQ